MLGQKELKLKLTKLILLLLCASALLISVKPALGWSNGGYSADPAQPDYGTHDWIAQHALEFLPAQEKQYITDNLASYLYGTELPDNSQASDGIGDTGKHHIYFNADGTMYDNASAQRASQEYEKALAFLGSKDYINASKAAGVMSHYIVDVAVFGHVMGASTPWGSEVNHSKFEDYVTGKTSQYNSTIFSPYLSFDGNLTTITAFNATVNIAYDTTFDTDGDYNCTWINTNYNWTNTAFKERSGESLNFAVNTLADVLHTLYQEANPTASPTPTPTPTPTTTPTPTVSPTTSALPVTPELPSTQILMVLLLLATAMAVVYRRKRAN